MITSPPNTKQRLQILQTNNVTIKKGEDKLARCCQDTPIPAVVKWKADRGPSMVMS